MYVSVELQIEAFCKTIVSSTSGSSSPRRILRRVWN